MRVKAKAKGGVIDVKCLFKHPMETGLRKDKKTGQTVPAHFIQEILFEKNGKTAVTAYINGSVSKNPLVHVQVKGNAGDTVKVSWKDNKGESGAEEVTVG